MSKQICVGCFHSSAAHYRWKGFCVRPGCKCKGFIKHLPKSSEQKAKELADSMQKIMNTSYKDLPKVLKEVFNKDSVV